MPQHLVPWLLLAALIACSTAAAAGWNLGRKRQDENGEAEAEVPGPALPGELQGLDERLVSVAAKFRTLSESNQQLSAQLKTCTSQLHQAQAEIGSLKDERARLHAQRTVFDVQMQDRQQELERGTAHARALEVELANQTRGIENTTRQLARVDELLSTRIRELEARSAGSQVELAQRTEALAAAERSVGELETAARLHAAELHQAQRLEQELRQELEQQAAAGRSLAARVGALEPQLAQRDAQLRQQMELERQAETHAGERERSQSARIGALEQQLEAQRQAAAEARDRERSQAVRIGELEQHLEAQRQAAAEAREHERSQSARIGELEQQLEAQHQASAEARDRERSQSARIGELEQQAEEQRQAAGEARDHGRSQSARVGELESELARREQELHGRSTELEGLRHQLGIQSGRGDERAQRCAALEQELRLRLEEQGSCEGRARELEQELAARSADSEARVGRLEAELHERSAAVEALRGELAALAEDLCQRTEAQRAGELRLRECETRAELSEQELEQRHAQLESLRGDLACGSSQGAALARHCAELEERLRAREDQLQALHGECLALADGGAARDAVLEARAEERAAQQRLDLAALSEIAEGRIATVLDGNAGESPVPLPEAYLQGIEQRDLAQALGGLLGGPGPLSPAAVLRLSEHWREQHAAWKSERIEGEVVYLWADAPFVRTGLEPEGSALLVIVAGLVDGTRRVVWVEAGARDSEPAWLGALEELARRGMNVPRLVVGEDGLGIWPALARIGWSCAQQRSWDRRIEHVVEVLPKRQQRLAGEQLRRIAKAGTRAEANRLKDSFVARHRKRRPEAVARIEADWECLVGLYSFPADHWPHLRTTAVVESLLSQLRLQTSVAKPGTPTPNAESILWKLLRIGAAGLRKLNSPQLLPAVAAADRCVDGVLGGRSRKRAA